MSKIDKFFEILKNEIIKTIVLDTFITSIIVFLAANIILLFFNLPYYYAILIGIVFFVVSSIIKYRKIKLRVVEEKNPSFKYMLRTARDNIESTSIMALALFSEIVNKSNKLLVGNMMNYKAIIYRLIIIFILIVGSGFAASYNYKQLNLDSVFDKYDLDFYKKPFSMSSDKGLTETDDIYGISSLAKLGTEELDFELNSGISQLDLTKLKEEQEEKYFDESSPRIDVRAVGAVTSSETGIKEDLEIVRAFNEKKMKMVIRHG